MSTENNFSQIGECSWSPVTPEYHPGSEAHELEEEPSYHVINCYYEYGLLDYSQRLKETVNQLNTTNHTRYGLRKTLSINKDEVEEDPIEDEGTETFSTEGTEAFEDNGNEAFVEESTDALERKVKSAARADQGLEGSFERFVQELVKIKFEMCQHKKC